MEGGCGGHVGGGLGVGYEDTRVLSGVIVVEGSGVWLATFSSQCDVGWVGGCLRGWSIRS